MKVDPYVPKLPGAKQIAINARVELATDKYAADGATRGMIGYVIERYPDGNLEVEFSNARTGETIAQLVVEPSEVVTKPLGGEPAATRYYTVNDRPVMIINTADGGEDCLVYDFASGEMLPDRAYFAYVEPGSGKDVDSLDEDGFSDRVDALREQSGNRAIEQLRKWITQFGAATGDVMAIAHALGFAGPTERGDLLVEPVPAGYVKVAVKAVHSNVVLELRPRGSLVTRELCDAAFGAGRKMPIVDTQTTSSVSYPPLKGAATTVEISIDFSQPKSANGGGAHRIKIRRGQ